MNNKYNSQRLAELANIIDGDIEEIRRDMNAVVAVCEELCSVLSSNTVDNYAIVASNLRNSADETYKNIVRHANEITSILRSKANEDINYETRTAKNMSAAAELLDTKSSGGGDQ